MTDEKLLKLIDDYLEQDAHSAIMIDGEWGIGKSYFIKLEGKIKSDLSNDINN